MQGKESIKSIPLHTEQMNLAAVEPPLFSICGVSTMYLLGSIDFIGRNPDARTLMLCPCVLVLEDQWLPRENAHRYAGHLRSTLVRLFRRAVPKPDKRLSEGPNVSQ